MIQITKSVVGLEVRMVVVRIVVVVRIAITKSVEGVEVRMVV